MEYQERYRLCVLLNPSVRIFSVMYSSSEDRWVCPGVAVLQTNVRDGAKKRDLCKLRVGFAWGAGGWSRGFDSCA